MNTLCDLTVLPEYEQILKANGLTSLEAMFTVSNAEPLTKPGLASWRQRLRLTLTVDGAPQTFYLKRFRNPPRSARREVARSDADANSVAGLEWAWMRRMAADGIACTSPVAYGEELNAGCEIRSAVLTAEVPGDSLERWFTGWTASDRPTFRPLIEPLAELVRQLHQRGYVHRDLYFSHVFFDPASPPDQGLSLIDLQRVIRPTVWRRRWIVKDLASLNFSAPSRLITRADRVRWLTRYLGASKLDAAARRLVYRIVRKTLAIARHERRRRIRLGTSSED